MKGSIIAGDAACGRNGSSQHIGTVICVVSAIVVLTLVVLCYGQYSSRISRRRIVQLSAPSLSGEMSLEEVLTKRHETRDFIARPLTASQVGQLAWAGQGMGEIRPKLGTRRLPERSTDAMRLYFVTGDGVFFYNPSANSLEQTFDRDVRMVLAASVRGKTAPVNVGCYIVIAGSARQLTAKYGKKARSYILFEAGRIAQNIELQAVALELGTFGIGSFDTRSVAKACRVARRLEPVYIVCVGYPLNKEENGEGAQPKKVLMIIAGSSFDDKQFFDTKFALEQAGIEVVVAGSVTGPVVGLRRGTAESTVLLSAVNIADYDAVVFVGGVGSREYFANADAMKIARNAVESGKILAAIGIAPRILANAGVLKDVKATCLAGGQNWLKNAGATYTGAPVEHDGLIITARDSMAAVPFGRAIADALRTGQQ